MMNRRTAVAVLASVAAIAAGLTGAAPALAGGSTSHWTSAQCSRAVSQWSHKHPKASVKESAKYIASLKHEHGCKFGAL